MRASAHVGAEQPEVDVHAALLATVQTEATHLPIPPAGIGLLAFGALVVLLGVTHLFRRAGDRND